MRHMVSLTIAAPASSDNVVFPTSMSADNAGIIWSAHVAHREKTCRLSFAMRHLAGKGSSFPAPRRPVATDGYTVPPADGPYMRLAALDICGFEPGTGTRLPPLHTAKVACGQCEQKHWPGALLGFGDGVRHCHD